MSAHPEAAELRAIYRGKEIPSADYNNIRALLRGLSTGAVKELALPSDNALSPFCAAELERRGILLASDNPQPTGAAPDAPR